MIQAPGYLHNPVSDRQTVSVVVERDLLRPGSGRPGANFATVLGACRINTVKALKDASNVFWRNPAAIVSG
jgi:hypothetical protein